MIKMPNWLPEIDIHATIRPLFDVWMESMAKRYDARWFIITAIRVRIICWRNTWLINTGFNLYKRDER